MVKTALTFSASAIALAPSAPILLLYSCRVVKTAMPDLSESAMALAPSSPISLNLKSRLVRTAVTFSASAIA